MHIIKQKFKQGAASFYIVAFSTLILLIVATSFATVIISEIERTSNDDLSQSAYDSALAGIEDAKLAFYSYQNCLAQGSASNSNCEAIIAKMEAPNCDMVGTILGRNAGGEVQVKESSAANNNMQQAYTCVKINAILNDYRSTLSSNTQSKAIKLRFADGVKAKDIKQVKISWYMDEDDGKYRFTDFLSNKVTFRSMNTGLTAVPPTISLALVQTAATYTLDDFEESRGSTTDRGLIYLVPTDGTKSGNDSSHKAAAWDNSTKVNHIDANAFIKSNNKTATNLPYTVNCSLQANAGNEFACSALIDLPDPVNGDRNDNTFMFVVSLPYGKPTTDFALEFFCGGECPVETDDDGSGNSALANSNKNQANLNGVQIEIDSTGRANDLYRRVQVRMESGANDGNLSIMGPLELNSGSGISTSDIQLKKKFTVTCEYNFGTPTC